MNKDIFNILITGRGGQGVVLAGDVISLAFLKAGYDVKLSSSHGMAQRGGQVISHIRIGKKIFSPLISKEEVDVLMAMEISRPDTWMEYLAKGGLALFLNGKDDISRDFKNVIKKRDGWFMEIPYSKLKDLENIKTANMFMLGVLSSHFSIKKKYWLEAIREKVPRRMKDLNLSAFKLGQREFCSKRLFSL